VTIALFPYLVPEGGKGKTSHKGGILCRFWCLTKGTLVPALFLMGFHKEAPFYLDAGTGSIVLQAIVGAA
jgi:hypothetical protein